MKSASLAAPPPIAFSMWSHSSCTPANLRKQCAHIRYGHPGSQNWEATSETQIMMRAIAGAATIMAIRPARAQQAHKRCPHQRIAQQRAFATIQRLDNLTLTPKG